MLAQAGVRLVADVRAIPRSRYNPQFNADSLAQFLSESGIAYEHLPELGGRRGPPKIDDGSPNMGWENESFRNYAGYAATAAFREGLQKLRMRGSAARTAVMCAEAVWWRCHRRIITDYLVASGENVLHIMDRGKMQRAVLNEAAAIGADGVISYPPAQLDLLAPARNEA